MIDISELRSGKFYRTSDSRFHLVYVLRITFEDQIARQIHRRDKFNNFTDFDNVVVRILDSRTSRHEVYTGSLSKFQERLDLIELIDLPMKFLPDFEYSYVEFDERRYSLPLVCDGYHTRDRIFSQSSGYKFLHKLSVGYKRFGFVPDVLLNARPNCFAEIYDLYVESVGLQNFLYFPHYVPSTQTPACITQLVGWDFFFRDESNCNLAKLITGGML